MGAVAPAGPPTLSAGLPAQPGPDGLLRCPWALSTADYLAYHDDEWGRPVRTDKALYERLCLEAFQSGLAWITILRKREHFRGAFAGFDPARVAQFDDADRTRLLADTGIVRNRAKIDAAITNARAAVALGDGGLATLIWAHRPPPRAAPLRSTDEVPARSPESAALAASLRNAGFRFVGPTTAYALMQSCGMVDDHLDGCAAREGVPPAAVPPR